LHAKEGTGKVSFVFFSSGKFWERVHKGEQAFGAGLIESGFGSVLDSGENFLEVV
jgi:hypothetical protein